MESFKEFFKDKTIGPKFIEMQRKAAFPSRLEPIPDRNANFSKVDSYKVVYRTVAMLISPYHSFLEEILQPKLGRRLTVNEARVFLRNTHPYFEYLFLQDEEWLGFVSLYDTFTELFEEEHG